jgi:predicted RNA-binding protein
MNPEEKMCLSTVYMDSGDEQQEIMKDVARIEAEGRGFWLINLFGERTFIEGEIQTVNLAEGSFITLKKVESGMLLSV